jgi:CheY-like chemotaxis protein
MQCQDFRVLYVDDDPDFNLVASHFLKKAGLLYESAQSGQEALNKLHTGIYDVIISDYYMPQMDGLSLLKEIKRQKVEIPFILFSGRDREEVVIQIIEHGADYYVAKSGDVVTQFSCLIDKIYLACENRRARLVPVKCNDQNIS